MSTPEKKGMFDWYFKTNLLLRIAIGLIAGIIVGIWLAYNPEAAKVFMDKTSFFGDVFVRLLKMIIVPVILFSLIGGAASLAPSRLGRVGVKIIAFYMITSAIAVAVGLLFANITQPGNGMNITAQSDAAEKVAQSPTLMQIFLNIVPDNVANSIVKVDVLPIIFFGLVFGLAISFLKDSKEANLVRGAELLHELINAAAETMYKIVAGIMQYAPIGVFFLIAPVFARQGAQALGPLLNVTVTCYAAYIVLVIIGYSVMLRVFGLNPIKFITRTREAWITAFVTRSSNGTLPVSLRVSEENLGVPRSISSFTLPLGATINMNGTAIYLGICAMFIGYATGSPLTMEQQWIVVTTATLAAIGTAGVPGAGAIMLLMVLESIGMKVEAGSAIAAAYAMIFGIDALLDMGRTCLNVGGDITCTAIVAKTEGEIDMSKWEDTPARAA